MKKLIKANKVSLKSSPDINEEMVKNFIFENPSVLGLGELSPISREKQQPTGGIVDILLGDEENRYEVEVQLGATDPSHIIRTIEYWDVERKRNPAYNHCAVIIAEEITNRFMNVISLFNGQIPLIAYKITATAKSKDEVEIDFVKIIDKVDVVESEEQYEPADRAYWEKRSTPKMLEQVDLIFGSLGALVENFEYKYNKYYIGLSLGGIAKNFISFKPKKKFLHLIIKGKYDDSKMIELEDAGLDCSYESNWNEYSIKLSGAADFEKHKDLLIPLIQEGKSWYMD